MDKQAEDYERYTRITLTDWSVFLDCGTIEGGLGQTPSPSIQSELASVKTLHRTRTIHQESFLFPPGCEW